MAQLRIGVTLSRSTDDPTALLWSSGINQNGVLLMLLLQRLPGVEAVVAVDCSGRAADHPLATFAGVRTLRPHEAIDVLDVIVELGGRADAKSMARFRDRGGKLVSYMAGNAMAMNFEALASDLPYGESVSQVRFDATWITPQHWRMNRDACRITRSDKVAVAPHIWDPMFFAAYAREARIDPFHKTVDERPWRIGVLEPNVNVLKTFHLPLLVAEEAFRRTPDAIEAVLLFNTQHFVGNPHFDDLTTTTELFRAGKLFAEGRHATPTALARHVDAVVVHQWENDLNYLYWEVLWSGHPLVHNSPAAAEVGYNYAPFDPADGGRVLADAMSRHRSEAGAYRARALDFLRRFSIDSPAVIARHEALIEELFA